MIVVIWELKFKYFDQMKISQNGLPVIGVITFKNTFVINIYIFYGSSQEHSDGLDTSNLNKSWNMDQI